MANASHPSPRLWPVWLRVLVILLTIALLAAPLVIWDEPVKSAFVHREQVIARVRAAGVWGPIALMGLAAAQVILAPIPGQVINFVAGYLFGFWPGLLSSWLGLVIGSTGAMALARAAGRPLVTRLVSPARLARLDRWMVGRGLRFFFIVFLIPGLPDDTVCLLAGLTPLPLRALIAAAAIGRLPGIIGTVWAGAYARELPWQGWVALAGLIGIMLVLTWRYGERVQDAVLSRTWAGHQPGYRFPKGEAGDGPSVGVDP